eukprot:GHRQ01034024.1.p1 GENE.GHRQ01034024.1~~GHRQ01034024.1.p1  ORF type:complete len:212 (+),score=55.68 GHRQ01034024.1:474-1109(+)
MYCWANMVAARASLTVEASQLASISRGPHWLTELPQQPCPDWVLTSLPPCLRLSLCAATAWRPSAACRSCRLAPLTSPPSPGQPCCVDSRQWGCQVGCQSLLLLLLLLLCCPSGSVPVSEFDDPHWHPPWAVDPLLVASHGAKFAGWQMAATLLATDQACVAELQPMLSKAYAMASAKAYLHQYEPYGLGQADMQQCFAAVEDVLAAYAAL